MQGNRWAAGDRAIAAICQPAASAAVTRSALCRKFGRRGATHRNTFGFHELRLKWGVPIIQSPRRDAAQL